jgi:CheY-like chemotaxis protein
MGKPRILIVDDEKAIRTALHRWFSLHGFETDLATNGREAVDKCAENEYDVVTMDLRMPVMSGPDAIAAIKQHRPELPIVVFSGYPEDCDDAMTQGAAKVLTKPLELSIVEREVRKLLPLRQA